MEPVMVQELAAADGLVAVVFGVMAVLEPAVTVKFGGRNNEAFSFQQSAVRHWLLAISYQLQP
jgi:hypothetical protein